MKKDRNRGGAGGDVKHVAGGSEVKRIDKHMRALLDHLWGPTGSVILHIILIFVLYKYLVWDMSDPSPEMVVSLQDMVVNEIDELDDFDLPPDDFPDYTDDMRPPDVIPDDRVLEAADFTNDPELDMTPLEVLPDFQSQLILRDLYASRTDSGPAQRLSVVPVAGDV